MVSTNFKGWVGKKTSLQEIKTQANQCEHRAQRAASPHVGNLAGEASRSVCRLGRNSVAVWKPGSPGKGMVWQVGHCWEIFNCNSATDLLHELRELI